MYQADKGQSTHVEQRDVALQPPHVCLCALAPARRATPVVQNASINHSARESDQGEGGHKVANNGIDEPATFRGGFVGGHIRCHGAHGANAPLVLCPLGDTISERACSIKWCYQLHTVMRNTGRIAALGNIAVSQICLAPYANPCAGLPTFLTAGTDAGGKRCRGCVPGAFESLLFPSC